MLEARSRHPTCKESHDAASEPRHPQIRSAKIVYLPVGELSTWGYAASAHRGHGVTHESLMDGRGLDVGRNDDGMLPQV